MRLRGLFRVGARLFIASGFLGLAAAVTGVQAAWVNWIFLVLFVAGIADMGIAASYDLRARLRGDDGKSHAAVEADDSGFHLWFGDRAQESRRRYLEERDGQPPLADGAFRDMACPGGLSRWTPYYGQGFSFPELTASVERLQEALLVFEAQVPEKRLVPWQGQGIEFPEQPSYAHRDRYGVGTPPFPVHFRTEPETHELIDGVRMGTVVMSYHTDSGNPGCPVCEMWEREWGVFHG